jgi:hypothetical protein
MEILGDEAQVEAHFGPFRDSVSVNDLYPAYHRLINHFGRTRWYSWVTRLEWNLVSVHMETMLMLA